MSGKKERVRENTDIFDFELNYEEMAAVRLRGHDRPLILNNRDQEAVERIATKHM